MSNMTSRFHVKNRISVVLVLVVVAALTFALLVLTNHAQPSTSTTKAGSACAPYSAFPALKRGHQGTVSAAFDGFRATFTATWSLPKPSVSKDYQINDLCVISFVKGQEPAVLTEGYTGGAHCCELPVLYSLQQTGTHFSKVLDMTPVNFKYSLAFDVNGGFRPTLVGSHVLLRTEDDQFAYTFGCYACTPMPIVLDAFDGSHLTDVTGQYPSLIRPEATSLLQQVTVDAKSEHSMSFSGIGPFGPLAAWVADECALNRGAQAWNTVLRFQSAGELSNKVYFAETLIKGSYVTQLHSFLLKGDYCTSQFGQ
jgi:hypothetical protein